MANTRANMAAIMLCLLILPLINLCSAMNNNSSDKPSGKAVSSFHYDHWLTISAVTTQNKAIRQNSVQIDEGKPRMFISDFAQVIDLTKLNPTEITILRLFKHANGNGRFEKNNCQGGPVWASCTEAPSLSVLHIYFFVRPFSTLRALV